MRIVVDMQCMQSDGSRFAGIGRYSLALTKAMIKISPEDDFILLLNNLMPETIQEIRYNFRNLIPQKNIKSFTIPPSQNGVSTFSSMRTVRDIFIESIKPDLLHVNSVFEGPPCCVIAANGGLARGILSSATLYDFIPMLNESLYLPSEQAKTAYYQSLRAISSADLLLAISQYTADQGRQLLTGFKGKIVNISGAVAPSFRIADVEFDQDLLRGIGIEKKYVFCAAGFDARKNQERLIQAFGALPDILRGVYQLVLAGDAPKSRVDELASIAARCGLSATDVLFAGRVSDDALIRLYRNCSLFVFPSLWEGLGLPIIEAMACGAPVIASNTTSMSELLPFAEAGFDPHSVPSIGATMIKFLSDDKMLSTLRNACIKRAGTFSWEASARTALDAMHALKEQHAHNRAFVFPSFEMQLSRLVDECDRLSNSEAYIDAVCIARNEAEGEAQWFCDSERKVAWVTTWNKRCGIATYSKNLIDNLKTPPVVFCQHLQEEVFEGAYSVVPSWDQGKTDNLDELATKIEELHVDEVMLQYNYGLFDHKSLCRLIDRLSMGGIAVYITLHSTIDPGLGENFELAELAMGLQQAKGVFVHTPLDIENLSNIGIKKNVRYLPLGILHSESGTRIARPPSRCISTYGFFLPGKGLEEIIDAFAILAQMDPDIKLHMINAYYNDGGGISAKLIERCVEKIDKLGLGDRIYLNTDYLEENDCLRRLQNSDLVVFPYQKNTSQPTSAAVRSGLASGVPVAVTPLPLFADVGEAVHKLPGFSSTDIANGVLAILRGIAKQDEVARAIADEARRYCITHDYSVIAAYLEHRMSVTSLGFSFS